MPYIQKTYNTWRYKLMVNGESHWYGGFCTREEAERDHSQRKRLAQISKLEEVTDELVREMLLYFGLTHREADQLQSEALRGHSTLKEHVHYRLTRI
jgi:hypothetical protein